MRALWRGIVNAVFWAYERGTWQYDVLVIGIVVFVFFSPKGWFDDQPQLGPPPHTAQVQILNEDLAARTTLYRIDARLLSIPKRTPELEKETHDVLRKNVEELRNRGFQIERIDPVRAADGTISYYDVAVRR